MRPWRCPARSRSRASRTRQQRQCRAAAVRRPPSPKKAHAEENEDADQRQFEQDADARCAAAVGGKTAVPEEPRPDKPAREPRQKRMALKKAAAKADPGSVAPAPAAASRCGSRVGRCCCRRCASHGCPCSMVGRRRNGRRAPRRSPAPARGSRSSRAPQNAPIQQPTRHRQRFPDMRFARNDMGTVIPTRKRPLRRLLDCVQADPK